MQAQTGQSPSSPAPKQDSCSPMRAQQSPQSSLFVLSETCSPRHCTREPSTGFSLCSLVFRFLWGPSVAPSATQGSQAGRSPSQPQTLTTRSKHSHFRKPYALPPAPPNFRYAPAANACSALPISQECSSGYPPMSTQPKAENSRPAAHAAPPTPKSSSTPTTGSPPDFPRPG